MHSGLAFMEERNAGNMDAPCAIVNSLPCFEAGWRDWIWPRIGAPRAAALRSVRLGGDVATFPREGLNKVESVRRFAGLALPVAYVS